VDLNVGLKARPPPRPKDVAHEPIVEAEGEACDPGAYCPFGDCPATFVKTLDGFCAPGPNTRRFRYVDPNHMCIPGQWCPPGYKCPMGFEMKVSNHEGFCFEEQRMGPYLEPEFMGSDFNAPQFL
jgi:hypothetical protein